MSRKQVPEPDLEPPVLFGDQDYDFAPPGEQSRRLVATEEEIQAAEEATKDEDVTELTDEERGLFRSLLTIGRRTKAVNIMGHEVVIQTLTNADEMRVGLATKDYLGTNGFSRAHQVALVASCVSTLEGEPLYVPLSVKESDEEVFEKKRSKVADMYPIVVSQIYNELLTLEAEFVELAKKLGKLPG